METYMSTESELAAINDMLAAIGESPVVSLDEDSSADVANARRILSRINRSVQAKGYTFNIEEGVTLAPDFESNLIPYLPTYLSLMSTSGTSTYVNRGGWVYDRSGLTDELPDGVSVNLIRLKDYDEMPEVFRQYIVTKAARQFNARFFGAPEVEASLAEEEEDLKRMCFEYELDYGQYNMLDGDSFVQGILTR